MHTELITAVYEPKAKDHIRILFKYNDTIKSLFWLNVGLDGSIYISPMKKEIKSLKRGSTSSNNGGISVKFDEGEKVDITNLDLIKTSFHASGAINSIDSTRTYRKSLREIKNQELLCTFLFQHPDKFEDIESIKRRDVGITFPVEENYPLLAYVHVSPINKIEPVMFDFARYQSNIVLTYKNLKGCQDLCIQINILSLESVNNWPPYTYMLYPTNSG